MKNKFPAEPIRKKTWQGILPLLSLTASGCNLVLPCDRGPGPTTMSRPENDHVGEEPGAEKGADEALFIIPVNTVSCTDPVPFLFLPSATRSSPISEMILTLCRNLRIFRAFIKAYINCRIILSTCEPGMYPGPAEPKINHEGSHKSKPRGITIEKNENTIAETAGRGIPGRTS
jgi:hypothetical protein